MSVAAQEKGAVVSDDGTRIDVWRSGSGPPLVLVHGTTADHTRWDRVRGPLEERFTLHAMDRRGRRTGEDDRPYALEREVEDLLAVVRAAGDRPRVLGHSFGAMCALEAAMRTEDVERLVLYEGGFTSTEHPEWEPVLARVEAFARVDRREEALDLFLREVAQFSETDLAAARGTPAWQARLAALHTIPREMRVAMRYRFPFEAAARVKAPTLLLVGGASPASEHADAARVAKALPDARVEVLPGQGHAAMDGAPDLFVRAALRFLE